MGEASDGAGRDARRMEDRIKANADYTICIDAGHGFDDIGTSSEILGDTAECDITLQVAFALQNALTELGFRVLMTHDGTAFPKTAVDDGNNLFNPQERISYVNTLDIDYFISVHCDSYAADASVRGTRLYYSKGTHHSKTSAAISEEISSAINSAFPDAKECIVRDMAKANAYYVIRENNAPSSLIEIGFVTNKTDAENMLNTEWRQALSVAIAEGIADFFAE